MKIRIGASASSKMIGVQYEPIEVSSSLEIEKEVPDMGSLALEAFVKDEQDKLTVFTTEDVKRKLKSLYVETVKKRKELMRIINE